jgi:hypothetical protein
MSNNVIPEEFKIGGETSTVNTTITPLAGGATFTGTAELNALSDVMVSCFSDTDGILYFDFSVNGTDWRTFPTGGFIVSAGIHEFHTAVKGGRYFRVRFENGVAAQSTFQLYTYYGQFRLPSAPLNQPLGLDAESIMTRPTPWWLSTARGLSTGVQNVKKFGRNPSVGTSFEVISFDGVYRTPQAAAATTLRIKAGNASDDAAGSGARKVIIEGLDENFEKVTEEITTAGTSASTATTATFTRLYRAYVSESGTYATASAGSHAANIVIENSAGTEDWLTIDATDFPKSQSEIAAYSIEAGKTGYVKMRNLSVDSGKTIDLIFFSRTNIDESAAPYTAMRAQSVITGVSGGSVEVFGDVEIPFGPYVGPTDIGFMGKTGAGTASIAIEFEIFIINEV